jgi:ligand-binding sensor domain-containing protein
MLFRIQNSKFKILCLALFLVVRLNAQFYQLKNYNVKDGLPSSEVYAMMQDASGYLWFTTDMGVSRFNGYEFKNFSTENGLADNTNFGLIQDAKGRIWFRSFSGKLSYYEDGKIKTPACNSIIANLLERKLICSLFVDSGDTIWAGVNSNFVLKIAPPWKPENIKKIQLEKYEAFLIKFSETDFIYGGIPQEHKLCDLTVYNAHFIKSYSIPLHVPAGMGPIRFNYLLLKDHSFIVTADYVITHFNANGILSQTKNNSAFICLCESENGHLLTGTYDGVVEYNDLTFHSFSRLAHLKTKVITSVCADHENGFWYCTEGNGIYYIPFRNFSYYSSADGLPESKISCAMKAGNKVICGHLDGTITTFQDQHIETIKLYPLDSSLSSDRVTSIIFNDPNHLFISTIRNVFSFDTEKKIVEKKLNEGSKMLLKGDGEMLWSLRYRDLLLRNCESLKQVSIINLAFYSDNIYQDRSGKIWICSTNSVYSFLPGTGLKNEGENIPLLNTRVVEVRQDDDGNMWMVSRGSGVIVKRGNSYFNILQKDGLAGNMCRNIFIDSGNVVWVGTNNGLSRIDVKPGKEFAYTVTSYTSKNGLLTNEINSILRQGPKLWLIHNDGISVFDPKHIGDNVSPPPVFITGLMINNDTASVSGTAFVVSHDKNYFNISFIGLSYKDPGHLEYRYKMEGLDSAWNYTTYTSIKYQTLPPGTYRFIVYAKNNDGFWSSQPAFFSFTILPAWWQTWIFKIIATAVLLFFILLIFKLRLDVIRRRDRKQSVLQSRIAAIELNALRAQMNPHFVFNAINSVQYFITNNDPDSSQKYLSKFARLIRYVVDNSKVTAIPLKKEIEALTLYLDLEALRFGKRFEYEIKVAPDVDTEFMQIPSMLIQPYVENSIWHGIMHKEGNGKIEIHLKMKNEALSCTIRDNGIGRKRSMELKQEKNGEHKSVGLSNTKERLEIINQVNKSNMSVEITDVLDEKGNICGTNVEIYIPVS